MYYESKAMKEIRDIRDKNYEEIKNMSSKEITEYFKYKSDKIEKRIIEGKKVSV